MLRPKTSLLWSLALIPLAVALAGCGSSSKSTTSAPPTTTTPATTTPASLVPANIKSKGTLTVAADATYAPNEFIGSDGHTVVGMDADLATGARNARWA